MVEKKAVVSLVQAGRRSWRSRRLIWVAGLLAAAAVCAAAVYFLKPEPARDDDVSKNGTSAKADAGPSPVEKAYARGDYKAAAAELEKSPPQDHAARRSLAVAYTNAGEHAKALAIYNELEKAGKLNGGYTYQAAESARMTGDTQTAMRYYELSITRYQQENGPRADMYIRRSKEGLAELKQP